LTIKNNNIGAKGLNAIAEALSVTQTLESISVFGNNFDNNNGEHFFNLINNRFTYTGLYIDIDVYIVDDIFMIAEN
jgi:hypothetical protein